METIMAIERNSSRHIDVTSPAQAREVMVRKRPLRRREEDNKLPPIHIEYIDENNQNKKEILTHPLNLEENEIKYGTAFPPLQPDYSKCRTERERTDPMYIIYPVTLFLEKTEASNDKGQYLLYNTTTNQQEFEKDIDENSSLYVPLSTFIASQKQKDISLSPIDMIKLWIRFQNQERKKHTDEPIEAFNSVIINNDIETHNDITEDIKFILSEMSKALENQFNIKQEDCNKLLEDSSKYEWSEKEIYNIDDIIEILQQYNYNKGKRKIIENPDYLSLAKSKFKKLKTITLEKEKNDKDLPPITIIEDGQEKILRHPLNFKKNQQKYGMKFPPLKPIIRNDNSQEAGYREPTDPLHIVYPVTLFFKKAEHHKGKDYYFFYNTENITQFAEYEKKEDILNISRSQYSALQKGDESLKLSPLYILKLWLRFQNQERNKQSLKTIESFNAKTILQDIRYIIDETSKVTKDKFNIDTEYNNTFLEDLYKQNWSKKAEYSVDDIIKIFKEITISQNIGSNILEGQDNISQFPIIILHNGHEVTLTPPIDIENIEQKYKMKFPLLNPIVFNPKLQENSLRHIVYPIHIYKKKTFYNFESEASFSNTSFSNDNNKKNNILTIPKSTYRGIFGADSLALPMLLKIWYHYQNTERKKHNIKTITRYNTETIIEDIKCIIKEMTEDINDILKTDKEKYKEILDELSQNILEKNSFSYLIKKINHIYRIVSGRRPDDSTHYEHLTGTFSQKNPEKSDIMHVVYPIKVTSEGIPYNFSEVSVFNNYVSQDKTDPLYTSRNSYAENLKKKFNTTFVQLLKLWCHYQNAEREKQKLPKITTYNPKTIIDDTKFIIEEMTTAMKDRIKIDKTKNNKILEKMSTKIWLGTEEKSMKNFIETVNQIIGELTKDNKQKHQKEQHLKTK